MLFSGYTRIMEQTQCDGAPAENWDTLRYKKALEVCLSHCQSSFNSQYVLYGRQDGGWAYKSCKCLKNPSVDCSQITDSKGPFDLYKFV